MTRPQFNKPPRSAEPAPAPDGVPIQRDANSPNERLAQLLAQFNGGSEFRVYVERIEPNGERTYMGTLALAETLFDDVRARWGGGRFTGRVVGPNTKYAGTVPPFRVDGAAKLEETPTSAPPVVNVAPSRTEQLIVDTLASIGRALEQLAQRQQSSMDPTDQLVKLAGVLATVNPSRGAAAAGDPADTVGLIRELMALQREMAEDRPAPSSGGAFGVALESAVKPLVGVLQRKMALEEEKLRARRGPSSLPATNNRGVPLADFAPHNGAPTPANGSTGFASSSNGVEVSSDPLVNLIRSIPFYARQFLLTRAAENNDPAGYVSLVLDTLTDEAYEEIQKQLPRADFVAVLVREIPPAAPYAEWFGRLTNELRASLELPGRGGLEAEGGPGEGTAAHPVDSLDLERHT